jgi:phosphodiesterase/alkaline phosphatase D-like protein
MVPFHRSYIYEYATAGNANLPAADQAARTHQPNKKVVTLSDYR